MANCETFGRAIFETLASGLPNVAQRKENAAAEYLEHLPYARFVQGVDEALEAIEAILHTYEVLSSRALEIGYLFDDVFLSRLLVSKICKRKAMGIADFDGTLYHKEDPERTERCIAAFQKYEVRVLCSARPLEDLLHQLDVFNLKVDWIIASSGAIVSKGSGEPLWMTPLPAFDLPHGTPIIFEGNVLQVATLSKEASSYEFRTEIYQGQPFVSHWKASKLHAVHRLLKTLDWLGQVQVFGDGPYDRELITYFDGQRIIC
jgi:hydroxymethylpyrimidine pyrophosphatase-like HAD family hydrolase